MPRVITRFTRVTTWDFGVIDLLLSPPDPPSIMDYGTLLETNMETQKGPYKDYSSSKMGLYGFPC